MANPKFSKTEPVMFGDFEAMPKVTAELRLRLSAIKVQTEQDIEHTISVMSKCFPDDEAKVKEFMTDNMYPGDFIRLRAFLVDGPQGLERYDKAMDSAIDKEINKALAEAEKVANE